MTSITKKLEAQIKDKIESEVSHIIQTYENEELKDKVIELAEKWLYTGLLSAALTYQEQKSLAHLDMQDLHGINK